ncbi:hypothetical protein MSAN_01683600 [Mycena sanguinolenta]|uniref:Uncharacterized protein n=1 Tax=Mycena sanguinolenta TaxID=230812 RepID=A0A8H6XXV1_9AGAR|nr:hypothetical protein MSAN_01683600 [Mycena sanguinolenta]
MTFSHYFSSLSSSAGGIGISAIDLVDADDFLGPFTHASPDLQGMGEEGLRGGSGFGSVPPSASASGLGFVPPPFASGLGFVPSSLAFRLHTPPTSAFLVLRLYTATDSAKRSSYSFSLRLRARLRFSLPRISTPPTSGLLPRTSTPPTSAFLSLSPTPTPISALLPRISTPPTSAKGSEETDEETERREGKRLVGEGQGMGLPAASFTRALALFPDDERRERRGAEGVGSGEKKARKRGGWRVGSGGVFVVDGGLCGGKDVEDVFGAGFYDTTTDSPATT